MGADSRVKYCDNDFDNKLIVSNLRRLINQIWKLLPMKENEEDWQKQLDSVLVELRGLHAMFGDQLDFLVLLSKLEGLRGVENFITYRVIVFSSISLLTELTNSLDVRKS